MPGPLFASSVGCFGKQDCQICTGREEGEFASVVWLMTLIGSKGGSEFTHSQCVPKAGFITFCQPMTAAQMTRKTYDLVISQIGLVQCVLITQSTQCCNRFFTPNHGKASRILKNSSGSGILF